ncbi:MAG: hypothetical protein II998_00355 [Clostridia bacterium]|nr:hypothetical protein [Clostridia bacterium]
MPEKKNGMIEKIKGVFKVKKPVCEDIVYQAEQVISEYIARKRNEILTKYGKKKHRLLNLLLIFFSGALLYFLYCIFK